MENAKVVAYDPKAMQNARKIFQDKIEYANSTAQCLKNADCALIVTEWPEFKTLKPEALKNLMKKPILIDGRRIYNPQNFKDKIGCAAIGLVHMNLCLSNPQNINLSKNGD